MELISLNSTTSKKRRMPLKEVVSIGLHVLLLVGLTYQFRGAIKPHKRQVARMLTPYAPGHSSAPVTPPKPKIIRPKEEPKIAMKEPDPPPPSNGGDSSGEADVSLAMANFYPAPKPDLAVLPHGTNGDIVVDVEIDETGKVVDAKLDQGLGHGVDEAVLAVLQTWTFYPATKAGKPVPSIQQLLFHFERA